MIVECEKRKLDVDFYQKTFHTHEYYTAPRPGETQREWGRPIAMDAATKARVDSIWQQLGL